MILHRPFEDGAFRIQHRWGGGYGYSFSRRTDRKDGVEGQLGQGIDNQVLLFQDLESLGRYRHRVDSHGERRDGVEAGMIRRALGGNVGCGVGSRDSGIGDDGPGAIRHRA